MDQKVEATLIIITNRCDERFLRALACSQWFAETVVINNNAIGDWKALKKKFDFRLISEDRLITNFAQARNKAMSAAEWDWVFFLDSDECLRRESIKELRQLVVNNLSSQVNAAWCSRTDIFLGKELKHGEAGKHAVIRLLRKNKASFVLPVHEVAQVEGKVAISNIHIYHYPHRSLREFIDKVSWYARLLAESQFGKEKTEKQNIRLSKQTIILQMIFYPPLKFLYNYVLRLGLLDGYPGLVYALVMSCHSFWVRAFSYEQHQKSS